MEDYASKIASIKGQIQQYKDEFAVLTDRIVGNDLEKDDFYFLAALDWAIHLIDGFLWMLEKRNITCAGALLRLQIDNCLRVCAPYIAKNREDVINTIIYEDKRLNRLPDDQGERMSDGRLKDRLAENIQRLNLFMKSVRVLSIYLILRFIRPLIKWIKMVLV